MMMYLKPSTVKYTNLYEVVDGTPRLNPFYLELHPVDVQPINKYMLFKEYGFQKYSIDEPTFRSITAFKHSPTYDQQLIDTIMDNIERSMSNWGKGQFIMDTTAIALDAVYRDTCKASKNLFTSIPLAHIDFDSFMHDKCMLDPFMDKWGVQLEKKLGKQVYDPKFWANGKKIVKICNVWISLTKGEITNHKLAVCDIRTVNEINVVPYIATRTVKETKDDFFGSRKPEFIATALKHDPENRWYCFENMKFGDAILFDSKNTPHGSVDNGSLDERQSIECRVMFVRNSPEIPLGVRNKFYSLL